MVGELSWDWRAERLREVLLDVSASIEARGEAVIDLANFRDPRAFQALMDVTRDELIPDCSGQELGRSLALFQSCDFAAGLRDRDFHPEVAYGFNAGTSR